MKSEKQRLESEAVKRANNITLSAFFELLPIHRLCGVLFSFLRNQHAASIVTNERENASRSDMCSFAILLLQACCTPVEISLDR